MKVSLFDYRLPEDLIARVPAEPRDSSRLLVLDRGAGKLEHRVFRELPELLSPADLLVLNDTRVIPARVYGLRRTMGKVEVLFLEKAEERLWRALVGSGGHVREGEKLRLAGGAIEVRVASKDEEGVFTLEVLKPYDLVAALLEKGHMPTPPYIRRARDSDKRRAPDAHDRRRPEPEEYEKLDRERYQTVFAEKPGAAAAPTAGLHFTDRVFEALRETGVELARVTLHVGLGTFRPVKTETVEEHRMHSEYFEVCEEAAAAINRAGREGRRIVAAGTTVVRVLESLPGGEVEPARGRTELFIYPPYEFRRVGAMLTNFHLPRSTLLMMVSAFAGRERVLSAYEEAVRRGYRFYSYGDAMLIL